MSSAKPLVGTVAEGRYRGAPAAAQCHGYHATPLRNLNLPNDVRRREGMIDRIVWKNGGPEVGDGSMS